MRIVCVLVLIGFTALLGWGMAAGDTDAYVARLPHDVWLQVTLADLYVGVFVYAVLVWSIERNVVRTLLWVLPALPLGNLVTVLYLVVRWPHIMATRSPRD